MRPYAQYCPIARTAEIIGDRWSILILRDMLVGTRRFNDLARGLPGISRNLLATRLRQLAASGLTIKTRDGYELTQAGHELRPLVFGMAEWGARWAFGEPEPQELNPDLLVWWMHGQIDHRVPAGAKVVVEVEFVDRKAHYWLVLESDDVSVCLSDPGLATDVVLRSTVSTMYGVWLGRLEMLAAISDGAIELSGEPDQVREFIKSLRLSPVRPAVLGAHAS